jgi:hypothetical protein
VNPQNLAFSSAHASKNGDTSMYRFRSLLKDGKLLKFYREERDVIHEIHVDFLFNTVSPGIRIG